MAGVMMMAIDRKVLDGMLSSVVKVCKPKEADPLLRRLVLFSPKDDGSVTIFATNEIASFQFSKVPCSFNLEGGEADLQPFAVDINYLSKFVRGASDDMVVIRFDPGADKIAVKCGTPRIDIGYHDGKGYRELYGRSSPLTYPDDLSVYNRVENIKAVRDLLRLLLVASDSKTPLYSGVYTDGNGRFVASDMFRVLAASVPDCVWGNEVLIPSEVISMLELFSDEEAVLFNLYKGQLWVCNPGQTTILSCYTREVEKFPIGALDRWLESGADNDKHVILDAKELSEVTNRMHSFFRGESSICQMKFGDRGLSVTGVTARGDRMKDVLSYSLAEGSAAVADFEFRVHLDVFSVLAEVHDGNFVLKMDAPNKPFYSENSAGIRALVTPFTKNKI